MSQTIEHLAENFWNIRGDFKIAHVINIGTHMSLVRNPDGRFILIDAYEPNEPDRAELMALTDNGSLIDAVLNVHPFHTVHCKFVHEMLPHARLIGTRRHHEQRPQLDWDPALIEDVATQQQFANLFDFSIPAGLEFVPEDESVHASSVLVRHRQTGIVHVDDTLMYLTPPSLIKLVAPEPKLRFHPKLADALQKRAGAGDEFVGWARDLARDWADTHIVCAAHNGIARLTDYTFSEAINDALEKASDTLQNHRNSFS
jgi:hypothetical protein